MGMDKMALTTEARLLLVLIVVQGDRRSAADKLAVTTDDRSKDCAQGSDNCAPTTEYDDESQKVQFATIIKEEAKVKVERAREEPKKESEPPTSSCQKQVGAVDCGLFALALATSIAFGDDPSMRRYSQEKMRSHLLTCFQISTWSSFHDTPM